MARVCLPCTGLVLLEVTHIWTTVADVNMPRDKKTNKPRGFAFLMYEDQRSTVLAVDNLSGASVVGRTLRVDHGMRLWSCGFNVHSA